MSEIHLRPCTEADRLAIEAMSAEIVRDGCVFPFESVEGTLRYWYSPGARVYVAEDGGAVLGSYTIKPVQPDRGAHVANAGYMVAEAGRGRGIGRRMGEHSIATARALGYRAMQFNFVVSTNASAVALWRSLGFAVIATLPGAFRHPTRGFVDVHVMYLGL